MTQAQVAQQLPASQPFIDMLEGPLMPWADNREVFDKLCGAVEAVYQRKTRDAEDAARELKLIEAGKGPAHDEPVYRTEAEANAILAAQHRGER